ncbi:uncharacterized protein LOC131628532 [Vicia villosa]|uniref:uncharacterized protein LOC131628532 n=1 Tax=Vicia villosa TaxID=3911 RepID=UPI00273AB2B1|nr:uncharacterized protein LOC131628532 [Vicia villosa]
MSVLVNGSPTKEFVVERGLRQGDPLSPFLYVIVAEGLKGLVNKAVENGDFMSFDINRLCSIDILQFADDTLLVGDGSWNHIWAIKSVLRAFEIVSSLGNGFSVSFWHSSWLTSGCLRDIFPSLFSASLLKDVSVGSMGGWVGEVWKWGDLVIAYPNNPGLIDDLFLLHDNLNLVSPKKEGKDKVVWNDSVDHSFWVKGCYDYLSSSFVPFGPANFNDKAFSLIWKMRVPLKIKAFGWRCFIEKIPTKDLLVRRGILSNFNDISCVFCGANTESTYHLFIGCQVVTLVWKEVAGWIDFGEVGMVDLKDSFLRWSSFCKHKRVKKGKE